MSIISKKVKKGDRMVFADRMLESCLIEAILCKDTSALYRCDDYRHDSPLDYLPDNVKVPDAIYSSDLAQISTMCLCDLPSPSEEKHILKDLRKISSLKRLIFLTSFPSFRFRIRLLMALPKVKLAYRDCADQDDISFLEHLIFILGIDDPFRIWWEKIRSALSKEENEDEQASFVISKDSGRSLENFFGD